ncbi:hypothetical protein B0H14DRAFT_2654120 [Mycena olivaceomarginata]|nr:hypothetical protein B0H14DRAFT_2654120 [Mycena olivaceomarginata]
MTLASWPASTPSLCWAAGCPFRGFKGEGRGGGEGVLMAHYFNINICPLMQQYWIPKPQRDGDIGKAAIPLSIPPLILPHPLLPPSRPLAPFWACVGVQWWGGRSGGTAGEPAARRANQWHGGRTGGRAGTRWRGCMGIANRAVPAMQATGWACVGVGWWGGRGAGERWWGSWACFGVQWGGASGGGVGTWWRSYMEILTEPDCMRIGNRAVPHRAAVLRARASLGALEALHTVHALVGAQHGDGWG